MNEKRVSQVRSLVIEIERLKAELASLEEGMAAHERELSALLGDAPAQVTRQAPSVRSAHLESTRAAAPALPKAAQKPAGRAPSKGRALQPTIKDTILDALRDQPGGVELVALTSMAYSDTEKANRKRCEKLLYKLASRGRVTHTGSLWSLPAETSTSAPPVRAARGPKPKAPKAPKAPRATQTAKAPEATTAIAETSATSAATPVKEKAQRRQAAARGAVKAVPKKRNWPKCSIAGCGKSSFGPSAARQLCFQHFREAGGKHYSEQKPA